jgi:hypothetical protein
MARHDHHDHGGEDLKERRQGSRLTDRGEQWTGMREAVFDALAGFDRPASAYDIAEAVSKAQGRRVAANSVYRILDLFVGANLARRVESANAYVANATRLPARLHLPDLRHLRPGQAHRRRQHRQRRPQGGREERLRPDPPGDRGPRHLRGLRLRPEEAPASKPYSTSRGQVVVGHFGYERAPTPRSSTPSTMPADIRALDKSQLPQLCDELRQEVISAVSVTGGHLGAGLGVVELTVAIHYVFDTPSDKLIWDVGHQCYPHKVVTGRRDRIRTLRMGGGLSAASPSAARASTTRSAPRTARPASRPRLASPSPTSSKAPTGRAIAVIGDGAATAGMAFEAMNNAEAPAAG